MECPAAARIRDLRVFIRRYLGENDRPYLTDFGLAHDEDGRTRLTRLGAILGSDIGHWDVPDITQVTEEAYEMVEKGLISAGDFRDFVFANPVRLWAGMNPDFFKGTVVEKQAAGVLTNGGNGNVRR